MKRKDRQRLARIERKCDLIIQLVTDSDKFKADKLIERLHETARKLREQCRKENEMIRHLLER